MVLRILAGLAIAGLAPCAVRAQQTADSSAVPLTTASASDTAQHGSSLGGVRTLPLPFRGGPLVTGYNVWIGSAWSVRTASNNEQASGTAFSMVGVQFSRSLFVRGGVQFSWLVEVVPAIVATVGAPSNRLPTPTRSPEIFYNRERYARYTLHDTYGVGIAPLGAEVSRPLTARLSAMFNVTAGGAVFSSVIPYGKATQANFTVAPALGLEYRVAGGYALSSGYVMHHLSNASFGASNPGLNSHMVFVRLSKARFH